MLGFQNRTPYIKLLKFYANRDNSAYLKKSDFQRKLVYQIETIIGLMESKRFHEWSQILILSPDWPCTKTKAKFLTVNHKLS